MGVPPPQGGPHRTRGDPEPDSVHPKIKKAEQKRRRGICEGERPVVKNLRDKAGGLANGGGTASLGALERSDEGRRKAWPDPAADNAQKPVMGVQRLSGKDAHGLRRSVRPTGTA